VLVAMVGVGPESDGFALSRTSLVGVGPFQRWSDTCTVAVRRRAAVSHWSVAMVGFLTRTSGDARVAWAWRRAKDHRSTGQ